MGETSRATPAIVVRLSAAHALDAAFEASPLARWLDRTDAVVLAAPDATGVSGAGRSFDPTVVAGALAARFPSAAWILEVAAARDYPYNIARRVGSVASLADAGAGVLFSAAPSALLHAEGADDGELAADAVLALHELWQSWPLDSVLADRETRTFVDASRIRRVDHVGAFSIAGPLQLPLDQGELPVVLQRASAPDDPAVRHADAVVVAEDRIGAFRDESRPVLAEVHVDGESADVRLAGGVGEGHPLVVSGSPAAVADALAALDAAGRLRTRRPAGLRERLGVRDPEPRLAAAAIAFAEERW